MTGRVITEPVFKQKLADVLAVANLTDVGCVTGPGRSGAIASVYASHMLKLPFIPYGEPAPQRLGRLLIVDTAQKTGKTLRQAERRYAYANPVALAVFHEPPRVRFWYEESGAAMPLPPSIGAVDVGTRASYFWAGRRRRGIIFAEVPAGKIPADIGIAVSGGSSRSPRQRASFVMKLDGPHERYAWPAPDRIAVER